MERLFRLPTTDAEQLSELLTEAGTSSTRNDGLAELIDADLWIAGTGDLGPPEAATHPLELTHGGRAALDAEALTLALDTNRHADAPKLSARILDRSTHATRARADLVPDLLWYLSPIYRRFRKPAGLDDFVISLTERPKGGLTLLSFHRLDGKPCFGPRERALVHLASLGPLAPETPPALWPHLAARASVEQLAERLTLPPEAVEAHLAGIRAILNLGPDADLVAHFLRGGGVS